MNKKTKTLTHPVDHGWAWMILVGSFGVHFLSVGYQRSFGMLFVEFQERYGSSSAMTSSINACQCFTYSVLSFVVMNFLVQRVSIRVCCLIGACLQVTGVACSSLVRNTAFLILTQGALFGCGHALLFCPSMYIVSQYFERRRSIATALSSCGASLGGVMFPALTEYLTVAFGFRGALLLLAGILCHLVVFVSLYIPPESFPSRAPCLQDSESPLDPVKEDLMEHQDPLKTKLLQDTPATKAKQALAKKEPLSAKLFEEAPGSVDSGDMRDQQQLMQISLPDGTSTTATNENVPVLNDEPQYEELLASKENSIAQEKNVDSSAKNPLEYQNQSDFKLPEVILTEDSKLDKAQSEHYIPKAAPVDEPQQHSFGDLKEKLLTPKVFQNEVSEKSSFSSEHDLRKNAVLKAQGLREAVLSYSISRSMGHLPSLHRRRHGNHTPKGDKSGNHELSLSSLPNAISNMSIPELMGALPSIKQSALNQETCADCQGQKTSGESSAIDPCHVNQHSKDVELTGLVQECPENSNRKCPCIPDLLRSVPFWLLAIFVSMGVIGTGFPPVFLPALAREHGLTSADSAFFLMASSLIDSLGRLIPGFVLHLNVVRPTTLMIVPLLTLGVFYNLASLLTTFAQMLVLALLYGTLASSFWVLQTLITIEVMGMDLLAPSIGYFAIFMGISSTVFFPSCGWLRDSTGTYAATFHLLALTYLVAALSLVLIKVLAYSSRSRSKI